ncbi:MAG TPA: heavy metal-binding domain-containing protein [Bacteroidales bacterium]|nr:heavy metal-binding domain-containing protein [Bacteroidales bacterium]
MKAKEDQKESKYYCPMHCEGDKTYDKPGDCPVCGMHLKKEEDNEEKTESGN